MFFPPLFSKVRTPASTFSPIELTNPVNSQLTGTGTAESVIGRRTKGKIRISGCWWTALSATDATIQPGEFVSVVGRLQNTLFVEPERLL